jgi:hypothetical protein
LAAEWLIRYVVGVAGSHFIGRRRRQRMSSSFLKGAVVGLVCAVLGGAGTLALAGSGVGGVFNLGVLNTVDAQTQLRGTTGAPQLLVTNQQGTDGAVGLHRAALGGRRGRGRRAR